MLAIPLIFISILLVGIVGMIYQPKFMTEFSYLFSIGVCGTLITVSYLLILLIGSCLPPEPILPLHNRRIVAAAA